MITDRADRVMDSVLLNTRFRRWRNGALVVIFLLLSLLVFRSEDVTFEDFIARIEINDLILENAERAKILQELADNPHAKAVILYVNSPGGTLVGGEALFKQLREVAAAKPLVAVMGSVATSGGYMAAIAADHIVAYQGTITGSVGVLLQTAEITSLAKKLGVELITVKSGALKGSPSPFESLSDASQSMLQSTIEASNVIFKTMVQERRDLNAQQMALISDGRVFIGTQALEHKLIDAIGTESTAKAWLHETHDLDKNLPVKSIALHKKKTGFEALYARFFPAHLTTGLLGSNYGIWAIWPGK